GPQRVHVRRREAALPPRVVALSRRAAGAALLDGPSTRLRSASLGIPDGRGARRPAGDPRGDRSRRQRQLGVRPREQAADADRPPGLPGAGHAVLSARRLPANPPPAAHAIPRTLNVLRRPDGGVVIATRCRVAVTNGTKPHEFGRNAMPQTPWT